MAKFIPVGQVDCGSRDDVPTLLLSDKVPSKGARTFAYNLVGKDM
jgi:hypothetical protein